MGGVIVSVCLFLFYVFELLFEIVKRTQGNSALQALLWGLYQTRRSKHISIKTDGSAPNSISSKNQRLNNKVADQSDLMSMVTQQNTNISIDNYNSSNIISNQDAVQQQSDDDAATDLTKDVVDEIFVRSRYRYKVDSYFSRLTSYCLKNVDRHA